MLSTEISNVILAPSWWMGLRSANGLSKNKEEHALLLLFELAQVLSPTYQLLKTKTFF